MTRVTLEEELEELERARPIPPQYLFKYVHPDRADVLENASIRFSPPLNTNDIFEVRQTFDLLMGPKMFSAFKEVAEEIDFEESLRNVLDESPLRALSNADAKALVSILGGGDLEAMTKGLLGHFIDQMPAQLNTAENIDKLLDGIAAKQFLLSLSERSDSSPMWAHYAANSSGFVIVFDTASEFFRRGESGELQGLHKIEYFDSRISELIDNPYAAINSKQADWGYEHEWRLYVKEDQISQVLSVDGNDIHLVQFPRTAVNRVILGVRTDPMVETRIRESLEKAYPQALLTRMRADRTTARLQEVDAA